jgi:hypothetical protein
MRFDVSVNDIIVMEMKNTQASLNYDILRLFITESPWNISLNPINHLLCEVSDFSKLCHKIGIIIAISKRIDIFSKHKMRFLGEEGQLLSQK